MPGTRLLFVASDVDRKYLVESVRSDQVTVSDIFDGSCPSRRKLAWQNLLKVGHHGLSQEVRLSTVQNIPGGVWSWVRDLSTLGDLGLALRSGKEPWLTLDPSQLDGAARYLPKFRLSTYPSDLCPVDRKGSYLPHDLKATNRPSCGRAVAVFYTDCCFARILSVTPT